MILSPRLRVSTLTMNDVLLKAQKNDRYFSGNGATCLGEIRQSFRLCFWCLHARPHKWASQVHTGRDPSNLSHIFPGCPTTNGPKGQPEDQKKTSPSSIFFSSYGVFLSRLPEDHLTGRAAREINEI